MDSVTINPEQVLCYAGLTMFVLGLVTMACFFSKHKVLGWTGLAVTVLGVFLACAGFGTRSDRILAEGLATLPIEWQEFSANLSEISDVRLSITAVDRFTRSCPPKITPEQYDILIHGSRFWGANVGDRAFIDSGVRESIIFDFEEKK